MVFVLEQSTNWAFGVKENELSVKAKTVTDAREQQSLRGHMHTRENRRTIGIDRLDGNELLWQQRLCLCTLVLARSRENR